MTTQFTTHGPVGNYGFPRSTERAVAGSTWLMPERDARSGLSRNPRYLETTHKRLVAPAMVHPEQTIVTTGFTVLCREQRFLSWCEYAEVACRRLRENDDAYSVIRNADGELVAFRSSRKP